jgi:ankyrin repeat protein
MRPRRFFHTSAGCIFSGLVLTLAWIGLSGAAEHKPRNIDQKLFNAVRNGNLAGVKSAIRQGASVSARTEFGETPLHLATNVKVAEVLIKAGADVNGRDREFEMTPLFNADVNVSRLLIEKGAQVNVRAKKGMTPLSWAVYWDQQEKVALLIEKGADQNAADVDGKSPLHIAANWGKMEIARLLIAHGANVNAMDTDCWTPLHWAAFEGTAQMMDLLISSGADCSVVSCRRESGTALGETPLDVAARWRSPDVSAYLQSRGCRRSGGTREN